MDIDELLKLLADREASDLHLKPMRPPMLRIRGKLVETEGEPLAPAVLRDSLYRILNDRQRVQLEESLYVDFGYSVAGVSRFRGSVYYQRGTHAAVFRRIPFTFPTLDQWGLPEVLKEFTRMMNGLVLVTGAAGSGKSSTLAAMVKEAVVNRLVHIVTVEDPIEFLLSDSLGSVSQREVGTDTRSFADALRNTLRQDPDIIMVGEMRDPETVATVLTAAETGHLVLSTLHSNSAAQTIDRIIDTFPEGQQRQVRMQLSQILQGVISLQLVERADGTGMVAAVEILRKNPRVNKLILEGKISEIDEEIERSVSFEKMQTMNQSLIALVLNGVITREAALERSPAPGEFELQLGQFLTGQTGESAMADSAADFSKILELREIKHLYEEAQDRHRQEMADRDETIQRLVEQVRTHEGADASATSQDRALREERDKLAQQLAFQKQEYDAKVEKLQLRIRELSSQQTPEAGRTGIFRR
jgi:twitching motility protein PilT